MCGKIKIKFLIKNGIEKQKQRTLPESQKTMYDDLTYKERKCTQKKLGIDLD